MSLSKNQISILSGNALKFIAAAAMVCDHVGVILFPNVLFLRVIGRLAFPIFAFMISEGAKHTRNKLRYLLTMAGFALVIQAGYFIYSRSLEMSVMVTFTLSLCAILALDLFKRALFRDDLPQKLLTGALFVSVIIAISMIDKLVDLDYGFAGCMLPVFASLFVAPKDCPCETMRRLDCMPIRVLTTAVGLLLLAAGSNGIQYWSFLSLPLLLLYSEKRGKLKTKYFFYIFYPLHLVILECASLLIG
ncbi:MAG: hypothetical protein IJY39_14490 [Clostridia bacterium]|nr:hypothetical protein [Clostridia bacterium]